MDYKIIAEEKVDSSVVQNIVQSITKQGIDAKKILQLKIHTALQTNDILSLDISILYIQFTTQQELKSHRRLYSVDSKGGVSISDGCVQIKSSGCYCQKYFKNANTNISCAAI